MQDYSQGIAFKGRLLPFLQTLEPICSQKQGIKLPNDKLKTQLKTGKAFLLAFLVKQAMPNQLLLQEITATAR